MRVMRTGSATVTAEQLLAMPNLGKRRELARGVVRVVSPAGWKHGAIAGRLAVRLTAHVEEHALGEVTIAETGYVLQRHPDIVYAPDVAFVRNERLPRGAAADRFFEGAPDVAIEVVSPSDTWSEVTEKVEDYLAAATPMVVVVEPERRRVHVFRPGTTVTVLQEDDALDGGSVVPGWRLPLRELFAEAPPAGPQASPA